LVPTTSSFVSQPRNTYCCRLLLCIRGGSAKDIFPPEILISASIFSFFCILYGAACAIDPRGTARVLYGHDKQQQQQQQRSSSVLRWGNSKATSSSDSNDDATIKFLMRFIGSIVSGIGLTSAFSVAYDIKSFGTTTTSSTANIYDPAIGIGFLPRAILFFWYAFVKQPNIRSTSNTHLQLYDTKLIWISTFSATLAYIGIALNYINLSSSTINYFVMVVGSILSSLFACYCGMPVQLFTKKQQQQQQQTTMTKHETLLTRLVVMYASMSSVLIFALLYLSPKLVNNNASFPAIGLAAITYALSQCYLTFISKDVVKCGCSAGWSVSMIALALLVGLGSLKQNTPALLESLFHCPCST
jgi:hypothetical protein